MAPPPGQAPVLDRSSPRPPAAWLLVDGSSLIFRAFYGSPPTKGPDGNLTNAIRASIDMLARFISDRHPERVVVATDEDWRPAFRVELIPSYKAHRVAEPIPPLLEPQLPVALEVMEAAGIQVARADGYEAEDVIASIAAKVLGRIEILSGDRDLYALVEDPRVSVLYPEGKGIVSEVDEAEITRRYAIPGRAYADYAVLRGDPSDGLPGLPGIGDKRAAAMIQRFGSIEALIKTGAMNAEQVDYLTRATAVVQPRRDLSISVSDLPLVLAAPKDWARLETLTERYGLASSVERLMKAIARS
ncbi:MAG TPA: 5'-3' exonuclease [Candidatus Dormibacteraeota bacterium]|nr:5'-3' exonuclease [Candidatus Dormibacteraeota bacterium]